MSLMSVMAGHTAQARKEDKWPEYRVRMSGVCGLAIRVTGGALFSAAERWLYLGGHVVFHEDESGEHAYLVEFLRDAPRESER